MFDWHAAYFKSEAASLAHTRGTMATLAAYANFDTMTCYPSQTTLAKLTGQSVETVRRHIKLNAAAGWLELVSRGTSHKKASVYRFLIPESADETPSTPLVGEGGLPSTPLVGEGSTPLVGDRPTTNTTTHDEPSGSSKKPLTKTPLTGEPREQSGSAFADREVESVVSPVGIVAGSTDGHPKTNRDVHNEPLEELVDSEPGIPESSAPWSAADDEAYAAALQAQDDQGPPRDPIEDVQISGPGPLPELVAQAPW